MEGGFYSEERWKGRCPFPRAPIPKTKIVHSRCRSSVEKKPLPTNENADVFIGMVKRQPRDISMVDKTGTFLLWYDTTFKVLLTITPNIS